MQATEPVDGSDRAWPWPEPVLTYENGLVPRALIVAGARLALRQQQIIAEETGVANTVDPLGGSWFVEALTERDRGGGLALPR